MVNKEIRLCIYISSSIQIYVLYSQSLKMFTQNLSYPFSVEQSNMPLKSIPLLWKYSVIIFTIRVFRAALYILMSNSIAEKRCERRSKPKNIYFILLIAVIASTKFSVFSDCLYLTLFIWKNALCLLATKKVDMVNFKLL